MLHSTSGTQAEIPSFTIYTARHTYAMALTSWYPNQFIQDGLGHRTEEMTQTYLESFESSVVDQYDEMIMQRR